MVKPRNNDFLIPLLTVLLDIAAIEGAFLLSYWLRFFSPLTQYFEVELGIPPLSSYLVSSLVFIPVWLLIFNSRKLYGTRRNTHLSDELFAIIRVITICMMIMMSATFFYREFSFSRGVFILLYFTSIITTLFGRFLVMEFEKYLYRKGRELKSIVIVGSNRTAERLCEHFSKHKEVGYELLGYYADEKAAPASPLSAVPYLGKISRLHNDIETRRIQIAMITLAHQEQNKLVDLLRETEGKNIEYMMVPDLLEMMTSRVRIQEIEGIPFITLKDIALSTWNKILKRLFDLVVSIVVLAISSPLFLLIAIIIKLTSKGPVFYTQERIGLDGIIFSLFKFRSMRTDAEEQTGPVRAKKGDRRTTTIGKILRRTSLDELPQLFNVILGHMSLVGPRPERPYFVEQFKDKIPRYLERHRVKTGMTGWAQVNGLRGDVPIEERTKYDIYYVENWSLVFDLKIIFKTIRAVIWGEDAY
ncbi:MAG: undecaprenyl-phosphate glucose phosphotransferase [Bacteroidetes bacterium]|nr:undecaprenyl-phosphate glucose phosphotransferase [Bacteroidota bacterium]